MELKLPDNYEELAVEWQFRLIELLKAQLDNHDVNEETAKDIVGEFMFELSMLHDQNEIVVNGQSYNPRIAFNDYSGNLICTDEETSLHEYAFGSTSESYGE